MDIAEGTPNWGINMTLDENAENKTHCFNRLRTASYASLAAKYAFERLSGLPTEVDVSSEFRYRDPIVDEPTLVFAVSQSGEPSIQ